MRIVVAAMALLLVAGLGSAVPVLDHSRTVAMGTKEVTPPTDLQTDSYALSGNASTVSGATVVVNSTAASSLEATVTVRLVTTSGAVVASSNETVLVGIGGKTQVSVAFESQYEPSEFARVDVSVEKSL